MSESVFVERGIIEGFSGSWGSGLGHLLVSGHAIPCDNTPTVRALQGCFGDVIGPGHSVQDSPSWMGQEIVYSMGEMGLVLGAFTPIGEWRDRGGPEVPLDGCEVVVEDGEIRLG